jgi:hypothetical protein
VGKREEKNQLVRTMRREEDNIKICLKEIGCRTGLVWFRVWTYEGCCERCNAR